MKQFIKYPISAFFTSITHAENTIFIHLLQLHYRYCGSDYDKPFFITDRNLSSITSCSTKTIWKAKKSLLSSHLVEFTIGDGNKTWYKILSPNGHGRPK